MDIVEIHEVERRARSVGSHWFDRGTKRFFGSRVASYGYSGADGHVYFVSSERQDERSRRAYSVRVQRADGRIHTVGEFQAYATSSAAHRAAKRLAEGGAL